MADVTTIIVSVLGGGGVVATVSAILAWRQGRREQTLTVWDSYERQIASAEKRGDTAEVERLRREHEGQLEAWRAQQGLAKVAPREISAAREEPALTEEEIQQLRRLLAQAEPLSPAFLSAEDYFVRANAYYMAGQYEEALAAYNRTLELRPDDAVSLNNRAVLLARRGRYEEALRDIDTALVAEPLDPWFRGTRAEILHRQGDAEAAEAELERALAEAADKANAHYAVAQTWSVLGALAVAYSNLCEAVARKRSLRARARRDRELDNLRDDPEYGPRFRALVGEKEPPPASSP